MLILISLLSLPAASIQTQGKRHIAIKYIDFDVSLFYTIKCDWFESASKELGHVVNIPENDSMYLRLMNFDKNKLNVHFNDDIDVHLKIYILDEKNQEIQSICMNPFGQFYCPQTNEFFRNDDLYKRLLSYLKIE